MNLKHISDLDLELNLIKYIKQEHETLSIVLHHIKEFDTRRLYLKLGFSNLYEYLTKARKYSSGVAQRRIEAARLLRNIPEMDEKIQSGRLQLSNINELSRAVKQKEAESKMVVTIEQKRELLAAIEDTTIGETQQILAAKLNLELKSLEKKTVQKDGSVIIQVTLSQAQYDKLMRCRDLGSHVLVNKRDVGLASTLEMTCDQYLKAKLGKQIASDAKEVSTINASAGETKKSSNATSAAEVKSCKSTSTAEVKDKSNTRQMTFTNKVGNENASSGKVCATSPMRKSTFPEEACSHKPTSAVEVKSYKPTSAAEVKINKSINPKTRQIVLNKHQCCQHVDPITKRKCKSRFLLQVEHMHPQWAGGTHAIQNMTVFCASHNQQKYRNETGIRRL